jgi:superfamily II DNA/RNA helicase
VDASTQASENEWIPTPKTVTSHLPLNFRSLPFFFSLEAHQLHSASMADQKLLDNQVTFSSFDLDSRLVRALAKLKFTSPTLVQAKAIPLALQGVDILARARTGSGKTAAYCLPVIQNIIQLKEVRGKG